MRFAHALITGGLIFAAALATAAPATRPAREPAVSVTITAPSTCPASTMDAGAALPMAMALSAVADVTRVETESREGISRVIVRFAGTVDPTVAAPRVAETVRAA